MPGDVHIYNYDSKIRNWARYFKGNLGFLNSLDEFQKGKGYYIYVEQDSINLLDSVSKTLLKQKMVLLKFNKKNVMRQFV